MTTKNIDAGVDYSWLIRWAKSQAAKFRSYALMAPQRAVHLNAHAAKCDGWAAEWAEMHAEQTARFSRAPATR